MIFVVTIGLCVCVAWELLLQSNPPPRRTPLPCEVNFPANTATVTTLQLKQLRELCFLSLIALFCCSLLELSLSWCCPSLGSHSPPCLLLVAALPALVRAMWLERWVALTGERRALPCELFSAGEVLRHPTAPSFILSSLFFVLVLPSLSPSLVNLCFPFRSPFPPVFQMHSLPSLPSPVLRQEVIFSSCGIDSFAVNLS